MYLNIYIYAVLAVLLPQKHPFEYLLMCCSTAHATRMTRPCLLSEYGHKGCMQVCLGLLKMTITGSNDTSAPGRPSPLHRAELRISWALGKKAQTPPPPPKETIAKSLSSRAYSLHFYTIRLLHGSGEMYSMCVSL